MFSRRCATFRNRSQPSATVRNRPQPFATVRNPPREDQMAVPMVSSAKGVTLRVFQLRVASFRVAGVALCDHSNMFRDVSIVVWRGRRNTFA